MVVARDELVFDWVGFQKRAVFVDEYFAAMRRLIPDWNARFTALESDPIGWDFCRRHPHRHPTEFLHDPLPRARAFIARFPLPGSRGI